jgi:hypothetical protein
MDGVFERRAAAGKRPRPLNVSVIEPGNAARVWTLDRGFEALADRTLIPFPALRRPGPSALCRVGDCPANGGSAMKEGAAGLFPQSNSRYGCSAQERVPEFPMSPLK